MRLDKYLSNAGVGSRKEVTECIKKGLVSVNGVVRKSGKTQVDYHDEITLNDEKVNLEEHIYIMLHKPKGVISSTEKGPTKTVMDLITHPQKHELFPVGRLDKDTTGLLLITNDGKLAHALMSPRRHVDKTYQVEIEKPLSNSDIAILESGVELSDFTARGATVEVIAEHKINLTISEGKFHQVKRMLHAVNNEVLELHRITVGPLSLDESLVVGTYRNLSESERNLLHKYVY